MSVTEYGIIAKRISTRPWIPDSGPGIGSCMYVHMYVRHAFGMQLMLGICVMESIFVFVCGGVCLHSLQHKWLQLTGYMYVQSEVMYSFS